MAPPLVSIVIPCYNAKKLLRNCFSTVLKTKYKNFEVIIIDDQSQDGSYEYLTSHYAKNRKFRIFRNNRNCGPSVTRNRGIKEANGTYIAFIETDMEVDPNWLNPLVKVLERDKKLGAVQSKTLDINRRDLIHSMSAKFNPHTFWVISPECGLSSAWNPDNLETTIGAVGSVVRTSLIRKIGGYDQVLVHNIDDIDLGWRLWLAGYKTLTVPESITYHWTAKPFSEREKATPKFSSEFHFYKGHRLILKNYEFKNVLKYLPWQTLAYSLNITRNILLGNFVPLLAYLKAIWWNITNLPDTLRQRNRIQRNRKISDEEMFKLHALTGGFFKFYFGIMIKNLLMVRRVFMYGHGKKSEKIKCLVCSMPLYVNLYEKINIATNYSYLICPHCLTGNLIPRPTTKETTSFYTNQKYHKGLSEKLASPVMQWFITRRIHTTPAEWIKNRFKKGNVLDVGCGNGEFLYELKNNGWGVKGCDISPQAKENSERLIGGNSVKVGDFSKITFNGKFKVVSFWHVLEHVTNPQEYFNKAYSVLAPKGGVVGEVPNFDSLALKLFKKNYSWIMIPVHISYFTKSSISRLAKNAGFTKIHFFTPPRALLNFALSVDKYLKSKNYSVLVRRPILLLLAPISCLLAIGSSLFGRGEVLRFVAEK